VARKSWRASDSDGAGLVAEAADEAGVTSI
jgi:hypothetical protein